MTIRSQVGCAPILLLTLALHIGCASAPTELDLPPQTLTDAPSDPLLGDTPPASSASQPSTTGETGLPKPEAPPPVVDAANRRNKTIVIQESESREVSPRTLFEASQAELRRRNSGEKAGVRITNETLAEHAEGGQLTVAAPPVGAASAAQPDVATGDASEELWRARGLDLRLRWKESVEQVADLEREVALLRRRFYDEDDPFYRDNEIKPAWDRAIEDLGEARLQIAISQRNLDDFLEEGRRAGALPGWLREGAELEPERIPERDDQADRRRREDPREPKILNEEAISP